MAEHKLRFDPDHLALLETQLLQQRTSGNTDQEREINLQLLKELYGLEDGVAEILQTLSSGFFRLLNDELKLEAQNQDTLGIRTMQIKWLEKFHNLIQAHSPLKYDISQVVLLESSFHWMNAQGNIKSSVEVTQRKIMSLMLGQNAKELTTAFEYRSQALELAQHSAANDPENTDIEWDKVQQLLSFYYQELLRVVSTDTQVK